MACLITDVRQSRFDVEGFKFGTDVSKGIFAVSELFGGVGEGQDDWLPFDSVPGLVLALRNTAGLTLLQRLCKTSQC